MAKQKVVYVVSRTDNKQAGSDIVVYDDYRKADAYVARIIHRKELDGIYIDEEMNFGSYAYISFSDGVFVETMAKEIL